MPYIGAQPTTAAFITDTFNGTGSQTAFTMSTAPANTNSILVSVSGVLQDPSTYSVTGTTLTFSAAPPSGTGNISVRFLGIPASGVVTTAYRTVTEFTATAGQTTFSVPSYTPGFIDVYRNGVLLGSANFTATNGTTVVLGNAASAGDLVEVISFSVSSVLNAIPATAGAVNSTYLLDASVTQAKLGTGVAGNGPAFSAYSSTTQNISNSTWTKVVINTEEFDTNNNFDTSTNRFTPNVAGYYQINSTISFGATTTFPTTTRNGIYRNGSLYRVSQINITSGQVNPQLLNSALLFLNGTTDYVELYGFVSGATGPQMDGGQTITSLNGCLVRAA